MRAGRHSAHRLLVELVSLGGVCVRRFDVGVWMRIAGAGATDRRVGLLAECLGVGIWGIAGVVALLIGIRPLGGIRGAHWIVQRVVWTGIAREVAGVTPRRLWEATVDRVGNVRDDLRQLGLGFRRFGRLG
jgi:hypothetical protein